MRAHNDTFGPAVAGRSEDLLNRRPVAKVDTGLDAGVGGAPCAAFEHRARTLFDLGAQEEVAIEIVPIQARRLGYRANREPRSFAARKFARNGERGFASGRTVDGDQHSGQGSRPYLADSVAGSRTPARLPRG